MTEPTDSAKPDPEATKRQRAKVDALLARRTEPSQASVLLDDGSRLAYTVRPGFLPVAQGGMGSDCGEPQAAIFHIAYTATGNTGPRPVCFVFNGGPGSSSVWLHFGALGPKRVPVPADGSAPASPYALVDNPLTWLAHFDLVFIDPPHTGYSVTASDEARKKLLSVDGDVAALAEFVRTWLAANGRFGSPLYVAGESYGTTRGAALADKLLDMGLALDGLILVSCAMDLQSLVFLPRNDLPFALFLPAFANVAQYHGLLKGPLGASPEAARQAAEAFVAEDYLAALHAGARLEGRHKRRIEQRMAALTGLPLALVEEKNLRITDQCFFVEALRAQGRIVGRLEARATAPMGASRSREYDFDPGMEALNAPYTALALSYYASLGLSMDAPYQVFNPEVNLAWNWLRGDGKPTGDPAGYTCTSTDLARALRRHPHLRVLAASGRYDLGTPYAASDWSLAQLDAPAEVLARVTHRHYDAGHMFYTRPDDLRQFKTDLVDWLAAAR